MQIIERRESTDEPFEFCYGCFGPDDDVVPLFAGPALLLPSQEISDCPDAFVDVIAFVLFSSLSVGENIMLPLREHTRLDEETMRIMARMKMEVVDLGGREKLMPSELSGGMVKRAALARAIVMDPQLLFCDEPSAGLDPVVAKQIDGLILDLRAAFDMSVIVVTHELESAFDIADRICVLDRGHVRIVDTVENVRNTDDQRVQDLLNRRAETDEVDPDAYLSRLTGDIL